MIQKKRHNPSKQRTMKILLVHNSYGKYSGEEAVVDKMASMLQKHGHEICFFRRTSEGKSESTLGKIHGFLSGIYSPSGIKGLRETLRRERPDLVNVHNVYPFISPAALFECRKAGVPVVMTIHNFRLICPTGLFMRNGYPCETCLEKGNEWSCIRYNCERSFIKSIGYTLRSFIARRTKAFIKNVDYYACITDFQRSKLIDAGFDANKIIVIPNSIEIPDKALSKNGKYIAFCGRLSREKGVDLLIDIARKHPEMSIKFAGELRDSQLIANGLPNNCELKGYLSGEQLNDFYKEAAFFVMASRWYEGFPMSILEAARFGKCTIGPNHGGFTEIIGDGNAAIGRLFRPNDEKELEQQIVELWTAPELANMLGEKAFLKLKNHYSSEVIYRRWGNLFNKLTIDKGRQ